MQNRKIQLLKGYDNNASDDSDADCSADILYSKLKQSKNTLKNKVVSWESQMTEAIIINEELTYELSTKSLELDQFKQTTEIEKKSMELSHDEAVQILTSRLAQVSITPVSQELTSNTGTNKKKRVCTLI